MYERNAIVIDRYFASIFGYDGANNIKNNSKNYFELVNQLEKYQESSETENNIMKEFESVANQIRETQKFQDTLNKRSQKYIENIKMLFESLDEEPSILSKKFEKISEDIFRNNQDIKDNSEKFVNEIREFNEKSETRSSAGKERRIIEDDYQKILNLTSDNFNKISKEKLKEIKTFIKTDDKNEAKDKIREKILKNGSKEKVPFDVNVIGTAIDVSTDIEQKRAEILMSLYDKTMRILDEIKKDAVKIDRHKKIVKDSKSKLEFLNVISEYIILFLDNERMNTMGGEAEHHRIMTDACQNLQRDLTEIQNMYSLLVKEMTGKASKKSYKDLYNPEYLIDLQEEEKKFEIDISKLNMMGTVIYPDYWRVEGMQKIYDTFKNIITNIYEKDLTEYEPLDITFDVKEEILEESEEETENDEKEQVEEIEEISNNSETQLPENSEEEEIAKSEEEEEFHWDDDDEEDELNFGSSSYILDNENTEGNSEEENEEIKEIEKVENPASDENYSTPSDNDTENNKSSEKDRDKEIDEILGFFDNEEDLDEEEISLPGLEDEEDNEDDLLLKISNDEEENEILDDDRIFDDEEEIEQKEEKVEKKKEKRRGLFGRRKK